MTRIIKRICSIMFIVYLMHEIKVKFIYLLKLILFEISENEIYEKMILLYNHSIK